MARILLVGCGCRGRALAASLRELGHLVRGTTRSPARLAVIEAAGAEAVVADPDRLGTLLPALEGVSAVCWLMGSAQGASTPAALHGPRLGSLLAKLVDTPVRGLVYEAAGSAPAALLAEGGALVREAGVTHRMPVAVVDRRPTDLADWIAAMAAAVGHVLGE
ncbi:MAG: hypothetical protein ACR2GL_02555 [Thermoleophilaceae bacterium]